MWIFSLNPMQATTEILAQLHMTCAEMATVAAEALHTAGKVRQIPNVSPCIMPTRTRHACWWAC